MPRNKGWFRVYDRMLDSPDILELNDSEFRVIVSLWCLASQGGSEDGRIGYKNGALWRRVAPQMKKDSFEGILSRLMDMGLILGEDGEYTVKDWGKHQYLFDSYKPSVRKLKRESMSTERVENVKLSSSDCQALVKQDSDTDSDSDTDTEKDTNLVGHSQIRVPYERIVSLWNSIMTPKGIPEVREISDNRKKWMKREWVKQREDPPLKTIEDFEAFFKYLAANCSFMFQGNWFTFDWLFKYQNNFTKAFEGNYDDRRKGAKK